MSDEATARVEEDVQICTSNMLVSDEVCKNLTQDKWKTRAKGATGADGSCAPRGFFGDYEVVVTHGGKTQKATVHWLKDGDSAVVTLP